MYAYYLKLALLSLRKTPFLSILMVSIIAIGISATMTTYTISYMMSQDPIPNKSKHLYQVQMDSLGAGHVYGDGDTLPAIITYQDANALLKSEIPRHHVALSATSEKISRLDDSSIVPKNLDVRTTTSDFFNMFEVPFLFGHGWNEEHDKSAAQVAVLTRETNDWLFNGENSVGKTFNFGLNIYQVVGVLDTWAPLPKFYDYSSNAFSKPLDLFIPFNTQIKNALPTSKLTSTYCWEKAEDESFSAFLISECMWVIFWVELPDKATFDAYKTYLDNYATEQQTLGRFQSRIFNKLLSVKEYLIEQKVVSDDSKMAVWLAFLFLIVCLLNCMSIMIAKFHTKAGEIGLRRAVGASRQDIMLQCGFELLVIGVIGGVLGLICTQLGLSITANIYHYLPNRLMQMDLTLGLGTLALAVVSSLFFGLLPVIRASRMQPSSQLKSL